MTDSSENKAGTGAAEEPRLELHTSRQFPSWLHDEGITLAFSTYQAGKLFLIGSHPEPEKSGRDIYVFNRTLNRCMGLARAGSSIYVSSLYQIHRFVAAGAETGAPTYIPQISYITGDIDVHDMIVEESGRLVFVNTLFNCLATTTDEHSFRPLWRPPFVSKLVPEDRCHLNGLAARDGRARYVTAVAETDVIEAWREHRIGGGIVIDVDSGEIIGRGLSMPHSPRWHDGSLFVNNAGTGHFGRLGADGGFEEIAFCPGFLRGMAIHKNFAIVGVSRPRGERTFQGLPLDDNLTDKKVTARCGLLVIDLGSGAIVHSLTLEGVVEEIFDVLVLPDTKHAAAIGFQTDEIRRVLSIDED